ncbi:uncharacterized protein LOC100384696 [Zea mays]|uniref:Uncharacterized protein n=1 Tax=Zea mays TaxID=4577 RepID=C4IZI5_MAIZE|nr:uncharacterized protein LOC100384696 [Zea mays]ACR34335.1 unknown [Zea mays]|eukprot:NP_001170643.1 uncharacterized protein LOC100384696 [Zea mays]
MVFARRDLQLVCSSSSSLRAELSVPCYPHGTSGSVAARQSLPMAYVAPARCGRVQLVHSSRSFFLVGRPRNLVRPSCWSLSHTVPISSDPAQLVVASFAIESSNTSSPAQPYLASSLQT